MHSESIKISDTSEGGFTLSRLCAKRVLWGLICLASSVYIVIVYIMYFIFSVASIRSILAATGMVIIIFIITCVGFLFTDASVFYFAPFWAFKYVRRLSYDPGKGELIFTVGWLPFRLQKKRAVDKVVSAGVERELFAPMHGSAKLFIVLTLKDEKIRMFQVDDEDEALHLVDYIARKTGLSSIVQNG